MYKVLLATHGKLCCGMLETLKFFSQNTENISAIPFYTKQDDFDEQKELENYINNIKPDDIVVIVTDICWGSVNQKVYTKVNGMNNVHLITGLNLPLMLELITMNEDDVNEQSITRKVNDCQGSIVYMRNYKIEYNDEDE